MKNITRVAKCGFLIGLIGLAMGCVVVPTEGRYDSEHHRYYHEHAWHDCGENDEHCRR
jgi:hypothetical protein